MDERYAVVGSAELQVLRRQRGAEEGNAESIVASAEARQRRVDDRGGWQMAPMWRASKSVLPPGWEELERRADGSAYVSADGLAVIASIGIEQDDRWWLHVSVSRRAREPSWTDLRYVKAIFVGPDTVALQVLPRESDYVNINPFVLHMWRCLEGEVTPDFTEGTGTL